MPQPTENRRTTLYFLSIYQATPDVALATQSIDQITHRGRILSKGVGSHDEPLTLVHGCHMPDGIAVSKTHNLIFWTQMGNPGSNDGSVWSGTLDGDKTRAIIPLGEAHTPKQIILDEQNDKLYFCDREGLRIHRCDIDGSDHEILVQTGNWEDESHMKDQTRWCVGIALSKKQSKIFWTQKGAPKSGQGRIFSAGIDVPEGATPTTRPDIELVLGSLPEPIDLELDDEAGVLYWTDRGEFPFGNTLSRKTLTDGEIPASEQKLGRQILAEGFGEAIGLAVDHVNDCVWVADLCGRIWKCDAHMPAAKQKVYESETSVYTGLAVLHH